MSILNRISELAITEAILTVSLCFQTFVPSPFAITHHILSCWLPGFHLQSTAAG
jgi:hypothetical protein